MEVRERSCLASRSIGGSATLRKVGEDKVKEVTSLLCIGFKE